ncbi:MAG: hypothetical protein HY042_09770, partial [Spirochaetia bacterium]|nr:hypothetical protein [Spirochaetia bacterium]
MNRKTIYRSVLVFSVVLAWQTLTPAPKPDNITMYAGTFTNTDLQSILFRGETDYRESYITVLTLDWNLEPRSSWFVVGAEGQFVKHFGLMRHMEVNGAMVLRSDPGLFPLQLAVGEGLSYATQNPPLENPKKDLLGLQYRERSRNLLNYMMFEGALRMDV